MDPINTHAVCAFPQPRGPDAEFGAPCRELGVSTAPSGAVTFSLLDVIPRRLTPALLCCYSRDLKSIWFIYKLSGQDLGKSFWLTSFSYDRMILQNRRYRQERHSLLSHSAVEKESRKITFPRSALRAEPDATVGGPARRLLPSEPLLSVAPTFSRDPVRWPGVPAAVKRCHFTADGTGQARPEGPSR